MVPFPRAWGPAYQPRFQAFCLLHLGEVDGQVVREPAVSGPERLRLGGLVMLHDAEAVVVEWLEVDDPVVTHPKLLLRVLRSRCAWW